MVRLRHVSEANMSPGSSTRAKTGVIAFEFDGPGESQHGRQRICRPKRGVALRQWGTSSSRIAFAPLTQADIEKI